MLKVNNKKEPLISVIVPVFNTEPYITRCLLSIKENTYSNLEIICIDDGSTDESGNICDSFASSDNRFVVIHKDNKGQSSARNTGLEIAHGDYISFVDSDDWVHESLFTILMNGILNYHTDMAMCDFSRANDNYVFEQDYQEYEIKTISAIEMMSKHDTKSYVWRRIYKKALLEGIAFDPTVKIEDALFNTRILAEKPDFMISYIPLKLYAYYYREGSLISNICGEDYFILGKHIYQLAQNVAQDYIQRFLVTESLKRLLFARYEFNLQREKNKSHECNALISKSVKDIPNGKMKTKYYCLARFPFLYRIYRIIKDPTMLAHEKAVKNSKLKF